ncbi:MAG: flippase-like domain-containing protein [Deltaproteobacteria bacterium]|jgi:uncharacterized protein (TIRG00374 family)|nr:flippase-like domain-containing protein [Deltaproteobacteria bacterium]MBW2536240.1 flippase-like domain-containing protein [Deltaproteobacteria bacterium]
MTERTPTPASEPDPGSDASEAPPADPEPADPGPRRRWLKAAIRLIGPALLVIVLLRIDDPGTLFASWGHAALAPLAVAVLGNVLNNHFKVLRWRALLRARGYSYPLGRAWKTFMASVYVAMLTPGRVGDVLRIQYLRHDIGVPYSEGLAVIVMDRFCDMYVLLAFVAVGVAHFASVFTGELMVVTWVGVAFTALAPAMLLVPGVAERLMGRVYAKVARERHEGGLERFLEALRAQVSSRLIYAVVLTAAAFLVNYAQGWLLGQALGLRLSFFDVMCMLAVTSLLSLLPISVSGVGVRELFLALVFPALGLTPQQGVSFGLLVFIVIYLVVTLGGFVAWQLAPPPVDAKSG